MMDEETIEISEDEIPCRCCGYKDKEKKLKCKMVFVYPRKKGIERTKKIEKGEPFVLCCPACDSINCITEYIKEDPGFRYKNKRIITNDWLKCMAYTGEKASDTIGYTTDGSKQLFVDITGDKWTREDFKEIYGHDPVDHIKKLKQMDRLDELRDADAKRIENRKPYNPGIF